MNQYSPNGNGPWLTANLVHGRSVLQLAERAGGTEQGPVVLRPGRAETFGDGMTIPANVLERTGYRLATEPEWEFACRAGTITSRYYGNSVEILKHYARYEPNSEDRAWPAGSVLPQRFRLVRHAWKRAMVPGRRQRDLREAKRQESSAIRYSSPSRWSSKSGVCILRGGSFSDRPAQTPIGRSRR